jgi:hypothetical protein
MAPIESSPTNVAQMGMGWNIVTGTIDLGLSLYDAILMVYSWIRDHNKKRARNAKEMELIRLGKLPH